MELIVMGDGPLGRAIATAARERGWPTPHLVGRPVGGGHTPATLGRADVVVEASRSSAVASNLTAAIAAGNRRFVIATTGWQTDRERVERLLREHEAVAIEAPNLSVGVALFGRLVEMAVGLFGQLESFDPFVVEWHRATKADRPSGTARLLADRIVAAHPRKTRIADLRRDGPAPADELDVAVVRAGASPGMHLVGFDSAGETVEMRLTARDRSAYAAGALAAADWLSTAQCTPGLQPFDAVVDDVLAATGSQPVATAA